VHTQHLLRSSTPQDREYCSQLRRHTVTRPALCRTRWSRRSVRCGRPRSINTTCARRCAPHARPHGRTHDARTPAGTRMHFNRPTPERSGASAGAVRAWRCRLAARGLGESACCGAALLCAMASAGAGGPFARRRRRHLAAAALSGAPQWVPWGRRWIYTGGCMRRRGCGLSPAERRLRCRVPCASDPNHCSSDAVAPMQRVKYRE
jgi:hypothetical protein